MTDEGGEGVGVPGVGGAFCRVHATREQKRSHRAVARTGEVPAERSEVDAPTPRYSGAAAAQASPEPLITTRSAPVGPGL